MADRSGHWISDAKRMDLYAACNDRCTYCARKVRPVKGQKAKNGRTLDHVIARDNGGNHAATNVVVACRSCNSAKGTMSLEAFLVYLASMKIDATEVKARVLAQLKKHEKIEARYGNRAGKPQYRKVAKALGGA